MDEPRTKATVLVVICKDDGNLAATVVRTKTDEYGVELVLRFLSTYERVEIKNDGDPSLWRLLNGLQSRRDRTTSLAQSSVGVTKRLEQWNVRISRRHWLPMGREGTSVGECNLVHF